MILGQYFRKSFWLLLPSLQVLWVICLSIALEDTHTLLSAQRGTLLHAHCNTLNHILALGLKPTGFEGLCMWVTVQELSGIVYFKISTLMQDVPIEEEACKAEKLYCQNDKWKICNSVPISSPVPQFTTLQSFVNEGTFSSLLPKYYQRVIKKILICCFIPIHLLIQVWKYSYRHRKILTQSLSWLYSGQSASCWLTLLTLLMPR